MMLHEKVNKLLGNPQVLTAWQASFLESIQFRVSNDFNITVEQERFINEIYQINFNSKNWDD
jgi:hypothetical protein